MSQVGQHLTHATYEDPDIVEGYIQRNALKPKQAQLVATFAKTIKGKKVLDLGCGPGHDSYLFALLGFDVTGLDYSQEMIRRAQRLRTVANMPTFMVGDLRTLPTYFSADNFDAIWASASLLHIPPKDMKSTLQGMTTVVKHDAVIYVGLKGGTGTVLVSEDKLGRPMQREFTLWTKESFIIQTKPVHWQLTDFFQSEGSLFMGKPTQWLNFFFRVNKQF